jgi:hypothetical protein
MLVHDLRYALRTMLRNRAFTGVAVLSLGLGIGANAAIFSLIDTEMLRPLPVRDPGTLVDLLHLYPHRPLGGWRHLRSVPLPARSQPDARRPDRQRPVAGDCAGSRNRRRACRWQLLRYPWAEALRRPSDWSAGGWRGHRHAELGVLQESVRALILPRWASKSPSTMLR